MFKLRQVCVLVAVVLLVPACKKTVEGETKAWTRNTQTIQELNALHPGFAAALKEQQDGAQALMASAKSISDPEASAKKMAEANSALVGGFVMTLRGVDSKTRGVREKSVTATTTATDVVDRIAARQASDDAQRVIATAEDFLQRGAPNVAAATAILRKVDEDLSAAERNLDRVIQNARNKRTAAKAGAAGTAAAGAGAAGAAGQAKPVAAGWKCSYCNFANEPTAARCRNCGATRH